MTAVQTDKDSVNGVSSQVLTMALELSLKCWRLCFGAGVKERQVSIEAGDWLGLEAEIVKARAKLKLATDCRVLSCYEAGRDGFWIHRGLEALGISNHVFDSSSIEVNRRSRRAKSDAVDARALRRLLQRYASGERRAVSVVRVPSLAEEDRYRLERERARLVKERGSHSARMKSLLVLHGVRLKVGRDFLKQLECARGGRNGYALGADLKEELRREYARYALVDQQLKALEGEQQLRVEAGEDEPTRQVAQLQRLKSVGPVSSWVLVMEFFQWRAFRNAKQLGACAGLTPTPYSSGTSDREQGISKAGNRRIRSLMVELAWMWLRYQPHSRLTRWFNERFAQGGKRLRRIGIVALARKLLVALWRYLEHGVLPEGAELKPL